MKTQVTLTKELSRKFKVGDGVESTLSNNVYLLCGNEHDMQMLCVKSYNSDSEGCLYIWTNDTNVRRVDGAVKIEFNTF